MAPEEFVPGEEVDGASAAADEGNDPVEPLAEAERLLIADAAEFAKLLMIEEAEPAAELASDSALFNMAVLLGIEVAVPLGLGVRLEPDATDVGAEASAPGVETGMSWKETSSVMVVALAPLLMAQIAASNAVKSHAISSSIVSAGMFTVSARRDAPSASVTTDVH